MNETDKVELYIEVSEVDSTEEDVDRMTRQLLSELRDLDVESVALTEAKSTPLGAKGDLITIGSIALDLLPAAIPSVIGLLREWVARGRGRTIKIKGRGFDFEGTPEGLREFLEMLDKGRMEK